MTSSKAGTAIPPKVREWMIRRHRSELTQPGEMDDSKNDQDWLARANGRLVFAQGRIYRADVPETLGDAIAPDGKLHKSAEVYAFGKWLLLDGAPGLSAKRGVQPDAARNLLLA